MAEESQQRRVLEAKMAAQQARDAQDAARAALKQMQLSGWKLGCDDDGRNYYYNNITGETSWEMPDGWVPAEEEIWVKNMDAAGNTYYFNQLSQETAWFPPCDVCKVKEGTRICYDCEDMTYFCLADFIAHHEGSCEMECDHTNCRKDHRWKAADQDKDDLKPGEKYCVNCTTLKAEKVNTVSKDAFCHNWYVPCRAVPCRVACA